MLRMQATAHINSRRSLDGGATNGSIARSTERSAARCYWPSADASFILEDRGVACHRRRPAIAAPVVG
jgi:hypothetical protein